MYEAYYELNASPFSIHPDPDFLFSSACHQAALDELEWGLSRQAGVHLLTGPCGCGKTLLLCQVLAQAGREQCVGLVHHPAPDFDRLMTGILHALGLEHGQDDPLQRYQTLARSLEEQYCQGRTTILVIDEAQRLGRDALEGLRLLSNLNVGRHSRLHVILAGQPGLLDTLAHPSQEALTQRLVTAVRLEPLSESETALYVRHRLAAAGARRQDIFTDAACATVYQLSGGVPRMINLLCDRALAYGYGVQSASVMPGLVAAVAADRQHGLAPLDRGAGRASTASEVGFVGYPFPPWDDRDTREGPAEAAAGIPPWPVPQGARTGLRVAS